MIMSMSYFNLLNNDIVRYCILPKLDLRDQYFLYRARCVDYLTIVELMKTKIKTSDTVTTFIENYGGFLSGSSLLKMISDEPWESEDTDIYIEATRYADVMKYIIDNKFRHRITDELELPYAKAKYTKYIDRIITLSADDNIVQLIVIKDIDIETFILKAFDFTILKNYYRYNGKYVLDVNHLDDIVRRRLVFDVDALSYMQRETDVGYKNLTPDTYVIFERIEKYVRRGFKINLGDVHKDAKCLQKLIMGNDIKCYVYNKGSIYITPTGEVLPEDYKGLRTPCNIDCWLSSFFEVAHKHIHIVSKDRVNCIMEMNDVSLMRHHEPHLCLSDSDVIIYPLNT